jgi:hypothetical protein
MSVSKSREFARLESFICKRRLRKVYRAEGKSGSGGQIS